jgi:hypothetical protein
MPNKPLDMELAEHECLSASVKAEVADILVNFAFWVFLLRRIGDGTACLDELIVKNQPVLAPAGTVSRLSSACRLPRAEEKPEWRPFVSRGVLAGRCLGVMSADGCEEQ